MSTADTLPSATLTRGLVAVGDSITRGSGDSMMGVRMQSWALWLAEALQMPYTCLAVDGARAHDALLTQIPRLQGPYDLACVYVGVNDVRTPGWDQQAYRADLESIAAALAGQARVRLLVGLPPAIGRPPAPLAAIEQANLSIVEVADRHGALTVAQRSVGGRELTLPDQVHLTARGEARLALLAAERLSQAGLAADTGLLREALQPPGTRTRLRYAAGAGALAQLRDWRRRGIEGAQRARERAR